MEFTELTLRLIFIFFPGIIVALMYYRFTTQLQKTPFFFLVYSFIFGMLSYIIIGCFIFIGNGKFYIYPLIYEISQPINSMTVMLAAVMAVPLAFILSLISNNKLLFKFAQFIKCSNQTGYHSIWEEFFDSSKEGQFITIRDLKNDIMYQGNIKSFSQTGEDRELIINNVLLFENESSDEINDEPYSEIFLSIPLGKDFIIEVSNDN